MRSRLPVTAVGLALLGLATACGGGSGSPGPASSAPASAAAPAGSDPAWCAQVVALLSSAAGSGGGLAAVTAAQARTAAAAAQAGLPADVKAWLADLLAFDGRILATGGTGLTAADNALGQRAVTFISSGTLQKDCPVATGKGR